MSKRYRLRSRNHLPEGQLSTQEILVGIRSGRFTGDEEISQGDGLGRWEKLAAHPRFYDEFLRRLFQDEYQVSNIQNSVATNVPPEPVAAKVTVAVHPQASEPPGGPTSNAEHSRSGNTIHQSEIDNLFSKSGIKTESSDEQVPGPVSPISLPVEMEREEPQDASGQTEKARSIPVRISLFVTILLGLVYFLGKPGPTSVPRVAESIPVPMGGASTVTTDDDGGLLSSERYGALIAESDDFYRLDMPLFLEAAEQNLMDAIALNDRRIEAFARLSLVLSRLYTYVGPDRKAVLADRFKTAVQRGRRIEPQLSTFYGAEAEVALAEGNVAQASRLVAHAAQTSAGGFLAAHLRRVIALQTTTSDGNPVLETDAAVPASHRIQVGYLEATRLKRLGQLEEARATLIGALQENPLHVPSYLLLGEVFSSQNELQEARNAFETAGRLQLLDRGVTAAAAYRRLGEVYLALGQASMATRAFQFSIVYGTPATAISGVSIEPITEVVRQAAAKEPYDYAYFLGQGKVLLSEKTFSAAHLFFRAANRIHPDNPEGMLYLGRALEGLATSSVQAMRAGENYRMALAKAPDSVEALLQLGNLESSLYHFETAQKLLDMAVLQQPKSVEPLVALGKHYFKRQDYQASLESFLKARQRAPLHPEVSYYAGLLISKFSKEQMREAIGLFYRAYTLDPQNIEALIEWLKLKVVYYEKNFAIKFVSALIQQNAKSSNFRWAMGEVYAANNEFNRAIRFFHEALDLDNRNAKVRMSLGKALLAIGEAEAAAEEFRLSSRLDYRNGEGYFLAGETSLGLKNFVAAERDISALLKALPNYPGAHRQMSKLSYLRGVRDIAVSEMQIEVTNNPLNVKFRQEFAELLYEYRRFDEAVRELSHITTLPNRARAPEFTADKTRAYLWLSRVQRARNQYEGAEGAIRLALELGPNDPDLLKEQGFVYQGQRRDKEAAAAFESYLKRSPTAVDAEEIKKLIDALVIEE